jgi:hypothetical protein
MRRVLIVWVVIGTLALQARGDFAVTLLDAGSFGTVAGASTRGWQFQVNAPITVSKLGLWDRNGDGLPSAHAIGIFSSSSTLLATATIPAGTAAPIEGPTLSAGGFRYTALASPVALAAGTYRIGAFYEIGGDEWQYNTVRTTPSQITYDGGRIVFGSSLADPTDMTMTSNGIFGPNFQFDVPEPASGIAVVLAAATAACNSRRAKCGR